MPVVYAMVSASGSATVRSGERSTSGVKPPILSFNVTNSSGEMAPETSALRPYVMPTLSPVDRPRLVVPAAGPKMEIALSAGPQRGPVKLVRGS